MACGQHCPGTAGAQGSLVSITMLLSLESSAPGFSTELSTCSGLPHFPSPPWCTLTGPPTLALEAAPQGHQGCLQLCVLYTCPCVLLGLMVCLAPSLLRQSLLLAAGNSQSFSSSQISLSFSPLLAPPPPQDPKDWHLAPRLSAFLAQDHLFWETLSVFVSSPASHSLWTTPSPANPCLLPSLPP